MKPPRTITVLLMLVGAISRSPAVAEQYTGATDNTLRIGVTVEPTCTVSVNPGEMEPNDAIALACRNLRDTQPEPIVIETAPRDGREVVLIRF